MGWNASVDDLCTETRLLNGYSLLKYVNADSWLVNSHKLFRYGSENYVWIGKVFTFLQKINGFETQSGEHFDCQGIPCGFSLIPFLNCILDHLSIQAIESIFLPGPDDLTKYNRHVLLLETKSHIWKLLFLGLWLIHQTAASKNAFGDWHLPLV